MVDSINPFESSAVENINQSLPPFAGGRGVRPYLPLVLGIVASVIGGVGSLNAVMYFVNLRSGSLETAEVPHYGYATLFSHDWTPHIDRGVRGMLAPLLLLGGIGLAKYQAWGRMWLIRYSAFSIVTTLFLTAYLTVSVLQEIPIPYLEWEFLTPVLSELFAFIFPATLLLVASRPGIVNSLE